MAKDKTLGQIQRHHEDVLGEKGEVQEIHENIAEVTKELDYLGGIRCAIRDN